MATGSITRNYTNTTYYFLSQGADKETLIYQQIEKSEFDRIRNNTYQDSFNGEVQSVEGNTYTDTLNGKNYAFVGFYDANGNWQSTGLSSTESQYGSVSNSIQNDKDLKKLLVGSSNTSPTNPNQPGTPGTSTPTQSPNNNQKTPTPQSLVYPIAMISTQQDRIKFTAVTYVPSGNLQTGQITSPNRTSTTGKTQVGPTVFLPVQSGISDANSVDWQGANLNEIDRRIADLSGGLMQAKNMEEIGTKLESLQM